MMLDEIPAEFGRVIPIPEVRCSQCGRKTMRIDEKDAEPLCSVCRIHDDALSKSFASEARSADGEHVSEQLVPVEYVARDSKPFGLGFAEIGASRLTQALAEDRRGHGGALLAVVELVGVYMLLGLVMLAVAAAS